MKKLKSVFCLLLAVVMMAGMMPTLEVKAEASTAETISYQGIDGNTQQSSSYSTSVYAQRLGAVVFTGNTKQDFVNIAKSQIGYHEGNSSSDLSGNNSSGGNNYTEYGRLTGTNGQEWCGAFVTWCAMQTGIYKKAIGSILGVPYDAYVHSKTYSNSGYGTYHSTAESFVGSSGVRYPAADSPLYTPKMGDVFVVKEGHTGIVTSDFDSSSKSVSVVEGNTNNKVQENKITLKEDGKYYLGSRLICAFLTPDFETSPSWSNTETATASSNVITNTQIESAIAWANNEKNNDPGGYAGYCAAFVMDAYQHGAGLTGTGLSKNRPATARQMGDALITHTDANPPRGACVFWYKASDPYNHAGHVGLSLGDGTVIHAFSAIKVTKISTVNNSGYTYRGWGAPLAGYNLATETGGISDIAPTIRIENPTYPSQLKQGSNFGLYGTIRSDYGVISKVRGWITDSSGSIVQDVSDSPNKAVYDVRTNKINSNLIFENLPQGNYIYHLSAEANYSGGTVSSSLIEANFSVTSSGQEVPTPVITISDQTYPSALNLGDNFGLAGTVTTNCGILTEVTGSMYSEDGNLIKSVICYPSSSTFDIRSSNINDLLIFEALDAGRYSYIVSAAAENDGKISDAVLINQVFTVGDPSAARLIAPENFNVKYLTDDSMEVSWTASPNAASYNVQYYSKTRNDWKKDSSYSDITATSYISSGMGAYDSWDMRVRAVNGGASSEWVEFHYYRHAEHTWDSGTVTDLPSCTMPGERTYKCTLCSAIKREAIEPTDHDYSITGNEIEHPHKEYLQCASCGKMEYTGNTGYNSICVQCLPHGTCGENLTWTLDEAGTLTISGTGDMYDYVQTPDPGYFLLSSTAPWSEFNGSITSVTIENGVTGIGNFAFFGATQINTVSISSTVARIGENVFDCQPICVEVGQRSGNYEWMHLSSLTAINVADGNASFKSVDGVLFNKAGTELIRYPGGRSGSYEIPSGVTSISDYAFFGCTNLMGINIPDSVLSIGDHAFSYCISLPSVSIPISVMDIGEYAFTYCVGLTNVSIPASVTEIGAAAFNYCSNLTTVFYAGSESDWSAITIGAYNEPLKNADIICKNQILTLPTMLKKIDKEAFAGVTAEVIVVPEGVTEIGSRAFADCPNLRRVIFLGGLPDNIAGDYLEGSEKAEIVTR